MNSFNFQIVTVANLAAITTPFPDHICYFTEDTENYYIWENSALKEIFVDASNITWNNITGKPTTISGYGITDAIIGNGTIDYLTKWSDSDSLTDSIIRDNGGSVSIFSAPDNNIALSCVMSKTGTIIYAENTKTTGFDISGIYGVVSGQNNNNYGGIFDSKNGSSNYGAIFMSGGATMLNFINSNIGTISVAQKLISGISIGGHFQATGTTTDKYAVRLVDGTEFAGKFLKCVNNDGRANWANINITEVTNGLSSALLGAPNGIATLDSNSKLVVAQLPISVMDYKGTYDIVTNTPNLQDGVGNQGDVYVCTTAGTRTFGVGNSLTVSVGDWLIYNGIKWEKTLGNNVGSGTVTSVGLSLGTTGTDVNISNSPITSSGNINLNIPTASATARGLLSIGDWTNFNSKVSAVGGTDNYVAKFTPNGTTIGNSLIRDNGTAVGVNMAPNANAMFFVTGGTQTQTIAAQSNVNNGTAIYGQAFTGAGTLYGVTGYANSSTSTNNIGLYGKAINAVSNYPIQLEELASSTGKFLKSMTADGKANWANITAADVSGAVGAVGGTNNYVAKFTPNGTTIGNSLIQDDGTKIGINSAPTVGSKIYIVSDQAAGINLNSTVSNINTANGISVSLVGTNNSANIGIQSGASNGNFQTTGVQGSASSSTGVNKGIEGIASGTSTNIGLRGYAVNGSSNYSIQLQDGSQTTGGGKFLKDMGDGKANWTYLPDTAQIMCSDLVTPITASTTILKGFWIAPCNGRLTDIFAYLISSQQGGSVLTVQVKMNGSQVALPVFANLTTISSTIVVSNTFTKGTLFEIFVTQIGDGTAKGLLTTINYERT